VSLPDDTPDYRKVVVRWLLGQNVKDAQHMKLRLTKSSVDDIEPATRDMYAWDDKTPGFGVKVTPAGARIYVLKYRASGAQRWIVLGRHGDITVDQARTKAIKFRGTIADGDDPALARDKSAGEPTINEFADRYLAEYAEPHKKPRSVEEDRRNLALHVRPALGTLKISAVTRRDVLKLHHAMHSTPTAANRVQALLSKMFELAEEWGLRAEASNPCRRIKKFEESSRERFLSADELKRLGKALDEAEAAGEHPSGIGIIRLLLLTGCRRDEILTLQWSFVDFERTCLRLPDSKTGAKVVRLGAPALDLLASLPRFASPFVFPAARGGNTSSDHKRRISAGHFVGIERIWQRVRARSELENVRLHDLRHTFASWSVMGGATLHMTGALLGHRQAGTTMRYAHLADDPVQAAADRVAGTIASALGRGDAPPMVVRLQRGGAEGRRSQ
jgi:integrase